jgi:hypothetical protein
MGEALRPRRPEVGLITESINDELLVFDSEHNRAHSLNATAARVWQACDGQRDVEELALVCDLDQTTLTLALERLRAAHLLDDDASPSEGVSRRMIIRRSVAAGAALGVAIPVVRSITAPSLAMAASGRSGNQVKGKAGYPCTSSNQCSLGVSFCNSGSCNRVTGQSCSNDSSCYHFHGSGSLASYFMTPCQNHVCSGCSKDSQCPASYPTCYTGSSGLCY